MSEWLAFSAKSAIFSCIIGRTSHILIRWCWCPLCIAPPCLVRDTSPFDDFLFDSLEPWDVRAFSIRKTADLPLQLWVGTFPRFVAIRFLFSIWNPYINHFTNNFSIHSQPSYPQKVVLHSITARFSLRPSHFAISLSLFKQGSNPWSNIFKVSIMLTITPPVWFILHVYKYRWTISMIRLLSSQ